MPLPCVPDAMRTVLRLASVASLALLLAPAGALAAPPKAKPIQVMVLGSYHMGNPGRDINNSRIDSVLVPEKQKQIVEVVDRLAKFAPTRVAVERLADRPGFETSSFDSFSPKVLAEKPNEIEQIGFRLAAKLGHTSVLGIDENSDTIDYFPYPPVEEFGKAHGQAELFERTGAWGKALSARIETDQKTKTVRQLLLDLNHPSRADDEMRGFYYAMLSVGDAKTQPGADLNAAWYLRNAKIFSKLVQVAKPGDRILVLYGAGHNYWLRHFVSQAPGFELVEPSTYLK